MTFLHRSLQRAFALSVLLRGKVCCLPCPGVLLQIKVLQGVVNTKMSPFEQRGVHSFKMSSTSNVKEISPFNGIAASKITVYFLFLSLKKYGIQLPILLFPSAKRNSRWRVWLFKVMPMVRDVADGLKKENETSSSAPFFQTFIMQYNLPYFS